MKSTFKNRLERLENSFKRLDKSFYTLCINWKQQPKKRHIIADVMGVNIKAAEYMCNIGLKYGEPQDKRFPLNSWTTEELKTALQLIDN